jgi:hypothetical protein
MKKVILALGFLIATVISIQVQAQQATTEDKQPRRWKRVGNQNDRIRKGLADGTITLQEANQLRAEQRDLKDLMRKMKEDGKIDKEERAIIDSKQDIASARIKLMIANAQKSEKGLTPEEIRQWNQLHRIKDGVAADDLTGKEKDGLKAYLEANSQMIAGFNADGKITPEEQAQIDARQDILSERIWLQRHDDQVRKPASAGPASTAN